MIKPWMKPYLKYSGRTITSKDLEHNRNLKRFIRIRAIVFILNPVIAAILLMLVAFGVI
jgi:hypothetical protein